MSDACLDTSLTIDQATDLARHFLGETYFAWSKYGACIVGTRRRGALHIHTTWRDTFLDAGVKLPSRPPAKFSAAGQDVKRGSETVARAMSPNMAKRIANALNAHKPDRRGQ